MQYTDITATQERVLRAYAAYIAKNGYAPMLKEIGKELGMVPSTVSVHVAALIKQGYITRRRGNRNVMLTEKATA